MDDNVLTFRWSRQSELPLALDMTLDIARENQPFSYTPPHTLEAAEEQWREEWENFFSPLNRRGLIRILLAFQGKTVVGISVLGPRKLDGDPYTGFIYAFGVKHEYRRQGIGRKMLKESVRRLEKLGYKQAVLAVYRKNQGAESLYRNFGFIPEQVSMVYDIHGSGNGEEG